MGAAYLLWLYYGVIFAKRIHYQRWRFTPVDKWGAGEYVWIWLSLLLCGPLLWVMVYKFYDYD
jgi:hypothetical protein